MSVFIVNLAKQYASQQPVVRAAGTEADPFGWDDVVAYLNYLPVQSNLGAFDSNNQYQHSGFTAEFQVYGTGDVISEAKKIDLDLAVFNGTTHRILFTSYKNKTPHYRQSTSSPLQSSFISMSRCGNLMFEFRNSLVTMNNQQNAQVKFCSFSNHHAPRILFDNNICVSTGAGVVFAELNGFDIIGNMGVGFNTLIVGSSSTVNHTLFRAVKTDTTGNISCLGNYCMRTLSSNTAVTLFDYGGNHLRYGGNRFGGIVSSYAGTQQEAVFGVDSSLDYTLQGIHNTTLVTGSAEDYYDENNLSVFRPVYQSSLFNACVITQATNPYVYGMQVWDSQGNQRRGYDAGAIEINCIGSVKEYHVDLGLDVAVRTNNTGSKDSPWSWMDWVYRAARLSYVTDNIRVVLRGRNTTPIQTWDTGPLSVNATLSDRRLRGTGSLMYTGYRVSVIPPPVLRVNAVLATAGVLTWVSGIKIEWATTQNLIQHNQGTHVDNSDSLFVLSRCVLKSSASCSGNFINAGQQAPRILCYGNTLHTRHTTQIDSGVFSVAGDSEITGNIVVMPDPAYTVIGSGTIETVFRGNLILGVGSYTFAGATSSLNRVSSNDIDLVFVDPNTSDFTTDDYHLTGAVVSPLDILKTSQVTSEFLLYNGTDMEGLIRDESPIGPACADAGAYEYNYKKPDPVNYYVDFSKQSSGAGTSDDRWNYSDFKSYLTGLSDTLLEVPVILNCVNHIYAEPIQVSGLAMSATGLLRFRAENPFALPYIDCIASPATLDEAWLDFIDCEGCDVENHGLVIRNRTGVPTIRLSGSGVANTYLVNNSGFSHLQYQVLRITGSVDALDTLTVAGTTITMDLLGLSEDSTVTEIADALEAHYKNSVAWISRSGLNLLFDAELVSGSLGLDVQDRNPVIVNKSWDLMVLGSGFGIKGSVHADVVGIEYSGSGTGSVGYSGFTGSVAGIAISGIGVLAQDNISKTLTCSDSTHSDSRNNTTTNQSIQSNPLAENPVITDFQAVGAGVNHCGDYTTLSARMLRKLQLADAIGNLRIQPQSTVNPNGFDAAPVESLDSAQSAIAGYMDDAMPVLAGRTPIGYAMDARMAVGDGFAFKIVGFCLNSTGYLPWNPSQVTQYSNSGSPARAGLTLSSNTISGSAMLSLGFGSVSVQATNNTDFSVGSSIAETIKNIAKALRSKAAFNTYATCYVDPSNTASLVIETKLFDDACNAYVITSGFGTVQGFQGGSDPLVINKVYPEASEYALFDRVESPNPKSTCFVVRLLPDQANKPIGQIAVIAEVLASGIPAEVGKRYVYAFANTPLLVKNNRTVLVKRVIMQS